MAKSGKSNPPTPSPKEIEIKLGVLPIALWQIEGLRPLRAAAGASKVEHLRSVYYDTADRKLHKHELSLRVRFNGDRRIQTIKAGAYSSPGLAERCEWEAEIDDDGPDLRVAKNTALGPLVSKKLRRNLKPIFETRVERTVFPLRGAGFAVEVAIDRGEISAGERSATISEVEVELKEGRRRDKVFALAAAMANAAPVHLEVRSKAERGYALLDGTEGQPERAGDVTLPSKATAAEAFRVIARSRLRQIVANEAAVKRDDPDGVHQ